MKASQYGAVPAVNLGARPDLRWIGLDQLWVNEEYQRNITDDGRSNIGRIIEKFSWARFTPLMVADSGDGRFAVIDGQHRYLAAVAHGGIADVPCAVVEAPELLDQARSFLAINAHRVAVNFFQLHHAGVVAGDPDALHLKALADGVGLRVPRNNLSGDAWRPHHLRCPKVVIELAKRYGDKPVAAALRLLVARARVEGTAFSSKVFRGVVALLLAAPDADSARLEKVLGDRTAEEWNAAAQAYRKMFGGSSSSALQAAIARDYNKGLPVERRIPERAEG